MHTKTRAFRLVDALYIALTVLPIVGAILMKILFTPASEGIQITGALVFCRIPMPFFGDFPITESQVNSLAVVLAILGLCLFLTHGITEKGGSVRQHIAEWAIEQCDKLVNTNMGTFFSGFAPFVGAIMVLSAFSSLLSLFGLYPPTSDINIVAGWAILVFILITYYKFKCGPLQYLKSFAEPVPFLAPLNVISEVATPLSMAFRHYGNVLSGSVISALVAAALAGLSNLLLGWLPGALGSFPLLRVGIPAVLSLYFDIFSGLLQAFIFAMLTMLYVSGAFPADLFEARKAKKQAKLAQSEKS